MRTDNEALLNAYLNEYAKQQAGTVSAGRSKQAAAAAAGGQTMARLGQLAVPKMYDPVPTLTKLAVQQNKAELDAAEQAQKAAAKAAAAEARAAQKAAEKKAKEEQKAAAEKAKAATAAADLQKKYGNAADKAAESEASEKESGAEAEAPKKSWWERIRDWLIPPEQSVNRILPGGNIASVMGIRPEAPPEPEIPQRSLSEQMDLYAQQAAKVQQLEQTLADLARAQVTVDGEDESSVSLDGFEPIPSLDQYPTTGNLLDISQKSIEKKQELERQQKALQDEIKTAKELFEQYDSELHAMVAELDPESQYEVWASPGYKLSAQEETAAKARFKEATAQNPGILWEEYVQQYPDSSRFILEGATKWQPKYMGYEGAEIAAAYAEMSDEEKAQAQKLNFVRKKISDPAAFANSAMSAAPFYTEFAERAQQANAEEKGFERPEELNAQQLLSQQRQQNPVAGTAGMLAGTMVEYGTGSRLMKAIPGVGKALGNAGEAVAGTRGAQALQQVPVLGRLGTADAVAGILGDTILDIGFDTIPSLARDVGLYQRQQERIGELDTPEQQAKLAQLGLTRDEAVQLLEDQTGELLTPGKIAGNAIGNLGANVAFNAAGELIPELWRTARDSLAPKPNLEVNHIPVLEGAMEDASRQVDEIPNLRIEMPGEGVATGAEGALRNGAELPALTGANGGLAALNGAGGNSEIRALTEAFENGTLTSKQIETLKPGGANRAAFEEATGLQLPATSSETRRMLRAGPGGLDNAARNGYSEIAGGAKNGTDFGAGVGGAEPGGAGSGQGGLRLGNEPAGNQRVFRQPVTDPDGYARAGATVQVLEDTTQYPEAFCSALDEAIEKNKHGLMVSPKTPQELADSGAITFMSRDGMCGAAVTADGDIEAVFRIPGGEGKRLSYQMVVTAIDNGGVKLDCYGEQLARNYAQMGFEPVARVRWNPDYAPEGWTYGPKDVYVMKLGDGLDADQVMRRMGLAQADGGFHVYTDSELKALPEMDYDAALAYRDSLISDRNGGGRPLGELDIQTADWEEILNSPEIRQAREQAKFETPTIAIDTPERQALRQQIADELLELGSFSGKDAAGNELFSGPVRQERRADIVIGPPAAGKSSVLANPLSEQYGSRIIDSDMAKAKLPEFNGGIGAAQVHEESARITENIMLQQAMDRGDNIVIPWVGKNPEKLRDALSSLHDAGYTVHLSLNELDPEKAARRAIERFQNTGRFVDPEYVLSVGWKPSEVYDILKAEGGFDSYVRYSNDVELGQPARLIERIGKAESSEVQDGGVGGHGGELLPDRNAGAQNQNSTESAEVGSQGNPAAFSVPETRSEPVIPTGMKERGFAESLRTQSDLPEEVKQAFVDQPEVYRQLSNAETLAKADGIMAQGLDRAQAEYASLLRAKDPAAIPLGKQIADGLIAQGNRDEAVALLREMSEKLTQSGQFSQAAAIALMKNDPMTALQYIQKDIDKLNREGAKKFKKWKDFALTEAEIAAFGKVAAGDEAELKALFEQVGARIAKEYPASMKEKLVEASHIAMLLNPRTQVRNVLANVAMLPVKGASDKIAAAGEALYGLKNADFEPTRAMHAGKESRELARQAYEQMADTLEGGARSKWENSLTAGMQEKEMFKLRGQQNAVSRIPVLGDALERLGDGLSGWSEKAFGKDVFSGLSSEKSVAENLRQFTYGLLEAGDVGFVKKAYTDRLASFLEARGIRRLEDIPAEAYETARQYALEATFKDDNKLTDLVSSLKRNTGLAGEMVLPFTKTPANLTVRALEYSPAGLAKGIADWAKSGNDPAKYIDEIAKGLTGTGVIALGGLLYDAGIITGPASDNARQAAFDKQQGKLPYALKVGDNYYTYDWAQPAATGLVLGAAIKKHLDEGGSLDSAGFAEIAKDAGVQFVDTLLEQSTLQNVADLFDGYGSFGENLLDSAIQAPQRLIPSLSGALARTVDPVQRQVFSNGDPLGTQLDTAASKIPVLSQNLPAAYDTWGNEVRRADSVGESAFAQLLSPGQLGNKAVTPLDGEITRLYEATGDENVFPRKADWSVTVGGEKRPLSNREYSELQKTMGQLAYGLTEDLMGSPVYERLPDADKAELLKDAYNVARQVAMKELYPEYTVSQSYEKAAQVYDRYGAEGLNGWQQFRAIADIDGNGSVTQEEAKAALDWIPSLDDGQRAYLWQLQNSGWKTNPYRN